MQSTLGYSLPEPAAGCSCYRRQSEAVPVLPQPPVVRCSQSDPAYHRDTSRRTKPLKLAATRILYRASGGVQPYPLAIRPSSAWGSAMKAYVNARIPTNVLAALPTAAAEQRGSPISSHRPAASSWAPAPEPQLHAGPRPAPCSRQAPLASQPTRGRAQRRGRADGTCCTAGAARSPGRRNINHVAHGPPHPARNSSATWQRQAASTPGSVPRATMTGADIPAAGGSAERCRPCCAPSNAAHHLMPPSPHTSPARLLVPSRSTSINSFLRLRVCLCHQPEFNPPVPTHGRQPPACTPR
jgi:hypothetical protein